MGFAARGRHGVACFNTNATSSAVAGFEQRRVMHAIRCRHGDHAESVVAADINPTMFTIIIQRLVNKFDDFMGIRLRAESI